MESLEKPNYDQNEIGALPYFAVLLLACGTAAIFIPVTWIRILASACTFALVGLFALFLYFKRPNRIRALVDTMIALAEAPPDAKVLDLGSGRGLIAIAFAKALPKAQVMGLDLYVPSSYPSGPHMEDAKRNASAEGVADRVEFQKGDLREIPFGEETFDIVACSGAIFTLEERDRRQAIGEVFRVLKPGGAFIWSEPPPPAFWSFNKSQRVAEEAGFLLTTRLRVGLGATMIRLVRPLQRT